MLDHEDFSRAKHLLGDDEAAEGFAGGAAGVADDVSVAKGYALYWCCLVVCNLSTFRTEHDVIYESCCGVDACIHASHWVEHGYVLELFPTLRATDVDHGLCEHYQWRTFSLVGWGGWFVCRLRRIPYSWR